MESLLLLIFQLLFVYASVPSYEMAIRALPEDSVALSELMSALTLIPCPSPDSVAITSMPEGDLGMKMNPMMAKTITRNIIAAIKRGFFLLGFLGAKGGGRIWESGMKGSSTTSTADSSSISSSISSSPLSLSILISIPSTFLDLINQ